MTSNAVGAMGASVPSNARQPRQGWACLAALLLLFASCTPAPVLRVSGGKAFEERPIPPAAYAAYTRARLLESRGDSKGAAAQYRRVLANDPDSAEAMVRLAAVLCASSPEQSATLFVKAEQLDAHSSKLWFERARCEMAQGHHQLASDAAKRALSLDPTLVPAIAIIVAASSNQNDYDSALIWLRASIAVTPFDIRLWAAMFENAHASRAEQLYAAAQMGRLTPRDPSAIPPRYRSGSLRRGTTRDATTTLLNDQLKEALDQRDVNAARLLATQLGLNPEELANLAFSRGAFTVALAQSDLLLAIDPENSSAWVTGLISADQLMQSDRVSTLLAHPPSRPLARESPLIVPLLALLQRRTALDSSTNSSTVVSTGERPIRK